MADFLQVVLGHEICGTVERLGPKVLCDDLAIGDRVVVYPWTGCLKCEDCLAGENNLCQCNDSGTTDIGWYRPTFYISWLINFVEFKNMSSSFSIFLGNIRSVTDL